jgi:hypothetical protein
MSTGPDRTPWTRWLVTLALGTVASAAIWVAGAHDVAYLGSIVVALAREPLRGHSCRGRLVRRGTSS